MQYLKSFFMRSPGEEEGTSATPFSDDEKASNDLSSDINKDKDNDKKSLGEKIHNALQDWSNDDQRDQEFDDTRP